MIKRIIKTTRLYKLLDNKDHEYYFEVVGNDKIEIERPQEPFRIGAGQEKKSVIVLTTHDILVSDDRKDTPLPITIRAYAVDDSDNIVVTRKMVFVYPRIDLLKD